MSAVTFVVAALLMMQATNLTRRTVLAKNLTVADTFVSSLFGLIGRRCLEIEAGLWIVPCQSVHTFWMRFPIDVVFIDRKKTVVHVVENMKPFRVSKHVSKANGVIELPVNVIRSTMTCVGDQIEISER
jgi:uncharacterized membrane protein (UPF0127 family)